MRWIFILFLAANFAMFFWGYQRDHMLAKLQTISESKVPTIYLISESQAIESEGTDDSPSQALEQPAEEVLVSESTEPSIEEDRAIDVTSEPIVSESPQERQEVQESEVVEADSQIEASQAPEEPEPASAEATEGLVAMITESVNEEDKAPDEVPTELETEDDPVTSVPLKEEAAEATVKCVTVGPVEQQGDAEKLAERLSESGLEVSIRDEAGKKQVGYWVLIPPMDTPSARAMVKKLGEAGITDVWRFPRGELRNSISLGLFSRRFHAEKLSEAIREKGFETEVRPRYIDVTNYWLEFSSADDPPIADAEWQEIAESIPDIELASTACEQIATR